MMYHHWIVILEKLWIRSLRFLGSTNAADQLLEAVCIRWNPAITEESGSAQRFQCLRNVPIPVSWRSIAICWATEFLHSYNSRQNKHFAQWLHANCAGKRQHTVVYETWHKNNMDTDEKWHGRIFSATTRHGTYIFSTPSHIPLLQSSPPIVAPFFTPKSATISEQFYTVRLFKSLWKVSL